MRYYFDTSIWRDYYEDRSDSLRPLGEWALQLIRKIVKEGSLILYSDVTVRELKIKYSDDDTGKIFGIASDVLLIVDCSIVQKGEAARLCKSRGVWRCFACCIGKGQWRCDGG